MEILDGFPAGHEGRVLFLPKDNLNTDGIYSKDYTYRDDVTPAEMARVVMENYDPAFAPMVQAGDVVVAGYNFGTGSSREQAATALQAAGIRCVIAASYSDTYLRNAINNGFLCVQSAELSGCPAGAVRRRGEGRRAHHRRRRRSAWTSSARPPCGRARTYRFLPLGTPVQELVIAGGVENMVRAQLA